MTPRPTEEIVIDVPFHDVDSMRVVWHGHYVKYLEIARTALTRKLGVDIQELEGTGLVWPIVTCNLKYVRPLRYGQKVRVIATLLEWEHRLKVGYVMKDAATGELINKAETVQVAVKADTGEMLFEVPEGLFPSLSGGAR